MENAYKMQQKKRKKDTIVEVPDPIAIINEEPVMNRIFDYVETIIETILVLAAVLNC